MFQTGPGTITEMVRVRPNAKLVIKKARLLPHALKVPVNKEVDRLESMGRISEVDRSRWASVLAGVPKTDKSICRLQSHH